jgi:hypothetical protein
MKRFLVIALLSTLTISSVGQTTPKPEKLRYRANCIKTNKNGIKFVGKEWVSYNTALDMASDRDSLDTQCRVEKEGQFPFFKTTIVYYCKGGHEYGSLSQK